MMWLQKVFGLIVDKWGWHFAEWNLNLFLNLQYLIKDFIFEITNTYKYVIYSYFWKTTLRFVSCCFRSTHQMSTEGFGCLLMYLLESGGKFEFEIEFKLNLGNIERFCNLKFEIVSQGSFLSYFLFATKLI
jgi:hypothetical protein